MDENKSGCGCSTTTFIHVLFGILTAMVGYHIHYSVFWTIIDFLFWPIAIIKWVIFHEITLRVLKDTFGWFFN